MPTIRTFRPTDFVSLISFLRDSSRLEVTAQLWPEVREGSNPLAVWGLLYRIASRTGMFQMCVSSANGGIQGLVVGHPRAGGLAWDVESLLVSESCRAIGVDLLDHTSSEAARRGARRVFLATPVDDGLARIASHAGFANYTSETIYSIRLSRAISDSGLRRARPRLRQDTHSLFQLYSAAVPCGVRSAEAMTIDEWLSLDRGGKLWAPSLGGSHRHLVWEDRDTLVGWLQLSVGSRSQHMELLVLPSHRTWTEEIVLRSLNQASHNAPIYVSVRDYQPEVASLLENLGFARVAEHLVFARQLAVRLPGRALVPARA